jgi:hypothetical protein
MKVLVACEFSGIVRSAFARAGHDTWSCDLLDTERPGGNHIKGDVREILSDGWDMLIAHPPCTFLASSGARWFRARRTEQELALDFVGTLLNAPIKYKAVENPIGVITGRYGRPSQTIQPWQFGHPHAKKICLWLRGLPKLKSTNIVTVRNWTTYRMGPSPHRQKNRSRFYNGIAEAMAVQWGSACQQKVSRNVVFSPCVSTAPNTLWEGVQT